jgi:hypothetical protein
VVGQSEMVTLDKSDAPVLLPVVNPHRVLESELFVQ